MSSPYLAARVGDGVRANTGRGGTQQAERQEARVRGWRGARLARPRRTARARLARLDGGALILAIAALAAQRLEVLGLDLLVRRVVRRLAGDDRGASFIVPSMNLCSAECSRTTHLYIVSFSVALMRPCQYAPGTLMYMPMSSSGFLMSGSCSSCCCIGTLPFADAVGRPRLGAIEIGARSRGRRRSPEQSNTRAGRA